MIGQMLGPYRVLEKLGEGGMGEVYKARDTRLGRSVAIKVLPLEFSADPDRRARFEREAKTIAGLTHPHICTLFDVGETDGATYLVLELLAGQTLADRLAKGPLPLDQALAVATEIADALSAAHRQGVIHRDLKPGNVMLTKAGAKLLDFGLAKLAGHGEQAAAASLASVPTQTRPLTSEGAIVGTLQYMAPEQVEGKPADARTDLWAFGAIVYEMLTGKRAFVGTSAASLIGNIMNAEPPAPGTFQPLTPPALDRLIRQCLSKSQDDRPDTAHDVGNDLRWMRDASGIASPTVPRSRRRRPLELAALAVVGLALPAAGAGLMWLLQPSPPRASVAHVSVDVRPADQLNAGGYSATWWLPTPGGSRTALTWTPDGQTLVFVGRRDGVQRLYARRLDATEGHPLENTEDAQVPAISPDGQWVAFWAGGEIRRVPVDGGPATALASGLRFPPMGLAWDHDGRLFYGSVGPIWVCEAGGKLAAVTKLGESELAHTLPSLLPGDRVLLYTARKRLFTWGDEEIVAENLATGARKVVLVDAADARYLASGHLVFLRRGVLHAVAFDPERLEVRGPQVPVLDSVVQALSAQMANDVTGAGQFAVSSTGTLAYVAGSVVPPPDGRLIAVDRHGKVTTLPAPVKPYRGTVRLSPDGQRLTAHVWTLSEIGLWVYDLDRGTMPPLNREGEVDYAIWTPNAQQVVFKWRQHGRRSLASQSADGSTPPRTILQGNFDPASFTPDGRRLAAVAWAPSNVTSSIAIIDVDSGRILTEPSAERATPSEIAPEFSRDGNRLAYVSNASGRNEVYVRPLQEPGGPVQVSLDGGDSPAWNPAGGELFFVGRPDPAGMRSMMAVDIAAGSTPRPGRPRPLFQFDPRLLGFVMTPTRAYDVALDGSRFYAIRTEPAVARPPVGYVNLITNWVEELKAKVPVKR